MSIDHSRLAIRIVVFYLECLFNLLTPLYNAFVTLFNAFVPILFLTLTLIIDFVLTLFYWQATRVVAGIVLTVTAVIRVGPLVNKSASRTVSWYLSRRNRHKKLYVQIHNQNSLLCTASLSNPSGVPKDIINIIDNHLDVRVDLAKLVWEWLREQCVRIVLPLVF